MSNSKLLNENNNSKKTCHIHFGELLDYMCPCDIESGKRHCMSCIIEYHTGDGHNAVDVEKGITIIKNKIMLNEMKILTNIGKEIDTAAEKYHITDDNVNIFYFNIFMY